MSSSLSPFTTVTLLILFGGIAFNCSGVQIFPSMYIKVFDKSPLTTVLLPDSLTALFFVSKKTESAEIITASFCVILITPYLPFSP